MPLFSVIIVTVVSLASRLALTVPAFSLYKIGKLPTALIFISNVTLNYKIHTSFLLKFLAKLFLTP